MAVETDYGQDFTCIEDVDARLSVTSGPLLVAQAVVRRLETPRGGLWYSPNYGTDLRQFINGHATVFRVARAIEQEALKDERVESAKAVVTITNNRRIDATLTLELADGPFRLVVAVDELTVELIDFRQAA